MADYGKRSARCGVRVPESTQGGVMAAVELSAGRGRVLNVFRLRRDCRRRQSE